MTHCTTDRTSLISRFHLPETASIQRLPTLFEDSSHDIYRVQTETRDYVIKQLDWTSVQASTFWQVMQPLFQIDLAQQLAHIAPLYAEAANASPLHIPKLLAQTTVHTRPTLLTEWLDGEAVETHQVTPQRVDDLARHLAGMHRIRRPSFGAHYATEPAKVDWVAHLQRHLTEWLQPLGEAEAKRLQALVTADFQPQDCVLSMPDLRWDQFLQSGEGLSALTDLDALVFAPPEFEWVLLEYLLTPEQAARFADTYAACARDFKPPNLQPVRAVYRALLFVMNCLGETDYSAWCARPVLFETVFS